MASGRLRLDASLDSARAARAVEATAVFVVRDGATTSTFTIENTITENTAGLNDVGMRVAGVSRS